MLRDSRRRSPESSRRRRAERRHSREQLAATAGPSSAYIPGPEAPQYPNMIPQPQHQPSNVSLRSRADSSTSNTSSTSSSLLNISRKSRGFGIRSFFTSHSKSKKKKKRRAFRSQNYSSSSVDSDLAYGKGYIPRSVVNSPRLDPGHPSYRDASAPVLGPDGRPAVRRAQTDEEILELGRQLSLYARAENDKDLMRAGRSRPSQIAAGAAAIGKLSRHNSASQGVRGIGSSRPDRLHESDDSDWESASDDDGDSSDDYEPGLAYGSAQFSSTHLPQTRLSTNTAAPTIISQPPPEEIRPPNRKPSAVDPAMFGPVNSLRGFINTPCGFRPGEYQRPQPPYEPQEPAPQSNSASIEANRGSQQPIRTVYPVPTSDPGLFDTARSVASGYTQHPQDSPVKVSRPAPVVIQAPKPMVPVSTRVLETRRMEDERYREREPGREDRRMSDGTGLAEAAVAGVAAAAVGGAILSSSHDKREREEEARRTGDDRDTAPERDREARRFEDEREAARRQEKQAPWAVEEREREARRLSEERALADREFEKRGLREVEAAGKRDDKKVGEKEKEGKRRDSTKSVGNALIVDERVAEAKRKEERRRERRERQRKELEEVQAEIEREKARLLKEGKEIPVVAPSEPPPSRKSRRKETDAAERSSAPAVDPFQFQVADDAFQTPQFATPARPLTPAVMTVAREPRWDDDLGPGERLSRKDSYEQEQAQIRAVVDETEHSTIPAHPEVIAAVIAATNDKDRRRTRDSEPTRDPIEEANRWYRLQKEAEREEESRSRSPEPSLLEKYQEEGDDDPAVRIVTPPSMEHQQDKGKYDGPNADVRIDHVITPRELPMFRVPPTSLDPNRESPPKWKSRDPSCERERPLLNLVRPTPAPTPLPEKQGQRSTAAAGSDPVEEKPQERERSRSPGPSVVIGPRGEVRQAPPDTPTSKSVTWGENDTKHYNPASPDRTAREREAAEKLKSVMGKKKSGSGWGDLAAAIAGAAAAGSLAGISSKPVPEERPAQENRDVIEEKERSGSPARERPVAITTPPIATSAVDDNDQPPPPGPKPPSPSQYASQKQMPGAFADDLDFAAHLAAGLESSGFDPNIVIEDPTYRKRDSPPGSNRSSGPPDTRERPASPPGSGAPPYQRPFAETVSDLGMADEPVAQTEPRARGFVVGEVPDTPASEKGAPAEDEWEPTPKSKKGKKSKRNTIDLADAEPVARGEPAPEADFEPRLSKKEQKKRDKAARLREFDDESSTAREPDVAVAEEWTPKLSKKEQKKRDRAARDEGSSTPRETEPESVVAAEPEDEWKEEKGKKGKKRDNANRREDREEEESVMLPETGPVAAVPEDEWADAKAGKKDKKKKKRESTRDEELPTPREADPERVDTDPRDEEWADNRPSKKDKKKRADEAEREESFTSGVLVSEPTALDGNEEWEEPKPSKKDKKGKKKRKSGSAWEEAEEAATPSDDRSVSVPGDAFSDLQRTGTGDDWDTPSKKSKKKSKRDSTYDSYDSPNRSVAPSEVSVESSSKKDKKSRRKSTKDGYGRPDEGEPPDRGRDSFQPLDRDVSSLVSEPMGYESRFNGSWADEVEEAQSAVSAPIASDRKDRKKRSSQDSKGEKSSKDEKRSSGGFFGLFKGTNGGGSETAKTSSDKDKQSFLGNAGTLGAGAGLAGAAALSLALVGAGSEEDVRPKATRGTSGKEDQPTSPTTSAAVGAERSITPPSRARIISPGSQVVDPEIVQRVIKPAIDPQYGDLLPLPPSAPGSPERELDMELESELPALPESRPDTPPSQQQHERTSLSAGRTHVRRRSAFETPTKSPSQTAIPIHFRIGQRSVPPSPGMARSSPLHSPSTPTPELGSAPRPRSRPNSWGRQMLGEPKPLYLVEKASSGNLSTDLEDQQYPALPPSEPNSSRESPAPESERRDGDIDYLSLAPHADMGEHQRGQPLLRVDTALAALDRSDPLGSGEVTPKAERSLEADELRDESRRQSVDGSVSMDDSFHSAAQSPVYPRESIDVAAEDGLLHQGFLTTPEVAERSAGEHDPRGTDPTLGRRDLSPSRSLSAREGNKTGSDLDIAAGVAAGLFGTGVVAALMHEDRSSEDPSFISREGQRPRSAAEEAGKTLPSSGPESLSGSIESAEDVLTPDEFSFIPSKRGRKKKGKQTIPRETEGPVQDQPKTSIESAKTVDTAPDSEARSALSDVPPPLSQEQTLVVDQASQSNDPEARQAEADEPKPELEADAESEWAFTPAKKDKKSKKAKKGKKAQTREFAESSKDEVPGELPENPAIEVKELEVSAEATPAEEPLPGAFSEIPTVGVAEPEIPPADVPSGEPLLEESPETAATETKEFGVPAPDLPAVPSQEETLVENEEPVLPGSRPGEAEQKPEPEEWQPTGKKSKKGKKGNVQDRELSTDNLPSGVIEEKVPPVEEQAEEQAGSIPEIDESFVPATLKKSKKDKKSKKGKKTQFVWEPEEAAPEEPSAASGTLEHSHASEEQAVVLPPSLSSQPAALEHTVTPVEYAPSAEATKSEITSGSRAATVPDELPDSGQSTTPAAAPEPLERSITPPPPPPQMTERSTTPEALPEVSNQPDATMVSQDSHILDAINTPLPDEARGDNSALDSSDDGPRTAPPDTSAVQLSPSGQAEQKDRASSPVAVEPVSETASESLVNSALSIIPSVAAVGSLFGLGKGKEKELPEEESPPAPPSNETRDLGSVEPMAGPTADMRPLTPADESAQATPHEVADTATVLMPDQQVSPQESDIRSTVIHGTLRSPVNKTELLDEPYPEDTRHDASVPVISDEPPLVSEEAPTSEAMDWEMETASRKKKGKKAKKAREKAQTDAAFDVLEPFPTSEAPPVGSDLQDANQGPQGTAGDLEQTTVETPRDNDNLTTEVPVAATADDEWALPAKKGKKGKKNRQKSQPSWDVLEPEPSGASTPLEPTDDVPSPAIAAETKEGPESPTPEVGKDVAADAPEEPAAEDIWTGTANKKGKKGKKNKKRSPDEWDIERPAAEVTSDLEPATDAVKAEAQDSSQPEQEVAATGRDNLEATADDIWGFTPSKKGKKGKKDKKKGSSKTSSGVATPAVAEAPILEEAAAAEETPVPEPETRTTEQPAATTAMEEIQAIGESPSVQEHAIAGKHAAQDALALGEPGDEPSDTAEVAPIAGDAPITNETSGTPDPTASHQLPDSQDRASQEAAERSFDKLETASQTEPTQIEEHPLIPSVSDESQAARSEAVSPQPASGEELETSKELPSLEHHDQPHQPHELSPAAENADASVYDFAPPADHGEGQARPIDSTADTDKDASLPETEEPSAATTQSDQPSVLTAETVAHETSEEKDISNTTADTSSPPAFSEAEGIVAEQVPREETSQLPQPFEEDLSALLLATPYSVSLRNSKKDKKKRKSSLTEPAEVSGPNEYAAPTTGDSTGQRLMSDPDAASEEVQPLEDIMELPQSFTLKRSKKDKKKLKAQAMSWDEPESTSDNATSESWSTPPLPVTQLSTIMEASTEDLPASAAGAERFDDATVAEQRPEEPVHEHQHVETVLDDDQTADVSRGYESETSQRTEKAAATSTDDAAAPLDTPMDDDSFTWSTKKEKKKGKKGKKAQAIVQPEPEVSEGAAPAFQENMILDRPEEDIQAQSNDNYFVTPRSGKKGKKAKKSKPAAFSWDDPEPASEPPAEAGLPTVEPVTEEEHPGLAEAVKEPLVKDAQPKEVEILPTESQPGEDDGEVRDVAASDAQRAPGAQLDDPEPVDPSESKPQEITEPPSQPEPENFEEPKETEDEWAVPVKKSKKGKKGKKGGSAKLTESETPWGTSTPVVQDDPVEMAEPAMGREFEPEALPTDMEEAGVVRELKPSEQEAQPEDIWALASSKRSKKDKKRKGSKLTEVETPPETAVQVPAEEPVSISVEGLPSAVEAEPEAVDTQAAPTEPGVEVAAEPEPEDMCALPSKKSKKDKKRKSSKYTDADMTSGTATPTVQEESATREVDTPAVDVDPQQQADEQQEVLGDTGDSWTTSTKQSKKDKKRKDKQAAAELLAGAAALSAAPDVADLLGGEKDKQEGPGLELAEAVDKEVEPDDLWEAPAKKTKKGRKNASRSDSAASTPAPEAEVIPASSTTADEVEVHQTPVEAASEQDAFPEFTTKKTRKDKKKKGKQLVSSDSDAAPSGQQDQIPESQVQQAVDAASPESDGTYFESGSQDAPEGPSAPKIEVNPAVLGALRLSPDHGLKALLPNVETGAFIGPHVLYQRDAAPPKLLTGSPPPKELLAAPAEVAETTRELDTAPARESSRVSHSPPFDSATQRKRAKTIEAVEDAAAETVTPARETAASYLEDKSQAPTGDEPEDDAKVRGRERSDSVASEASSRQGSRDIAAPYLEDKSTEAASEAAPTDKPTLTATEPGLSPRDIAAALLEAGPKGLLNPEAEPDAKGAELDTSKAHDLPTPEARNLAASWLEHEHEQHHHEDADSVSRPGGDVPGLTEQEPAQPSSPRRSSAEHVLPEKPTPSSREAERHSTRGDEGLDDTETAAAAGALAGGVALLAEKFGGSSKKKKKGKQKKQLDKRTAREGDLFDDPALWEGADRRPLEGSRMDENADGFWDVPDTEEGDEGRTSDVGHKVEEENEDVVMGDTGDQGVLGLREVVEEAAGDYVESPTLGRRASERKREAERRGKARREDDTTDIRPVQRAFSFPDDIAHEDVSTPVTEAPMIQRELVEDNIDDFSPVGRSLHHIPSVPDFRRSVPSLPPVQEEAAEETEPEKHQARHLTRTPEVNRDSGFLSDSPASQRRSHRFEDDSHRDSGVHLKDWPESTSPRTRDSRVFGAHPARTSGSGLKESLAPDQYETPDRHRTAKGSPEPGKDTPRGLGQTPRLREPSPPLRTPEPQKTLAKRRTTTRQLDNEPTAERNVGAALTPMVSERRVVSDNSALRQYSRSPAETSAMLGRRSASNTSIARHRTPEPLNLRPDTPGSTRSLHSATPPLRRVDKRVSGDLRSVSLSQRSASELSASGARSDSDKHNKDAAAAAAAGLGVAAGAAALALAASNSRASQNTTPVANEGRVRTKDMADVYDGYGEGRIGSPRSPTRPHSMRRRQSMQVLDLENKVKELEAENLALTSARTQVEQTASQRAPMALAQRDAEIDALKSNIAFLQKEVDRLTEVNEGLSSANAQIAVTHTDRYRRLESQHAEASRDLTEHGARLAQKDAEIAALRSELSETQSRIREMQDQILSSSPSSSASDFLHIRDVDYFDQRCQALCSHVQQWVLRFSKFSDMRACRLTSEINDEKIIDRLDNAVLDGSDVDTYLHDRVRRRDIFMSMTMTMIWEFVFTRYLFGMDREQRQKLKSLERTLLEVGPPHAVRQWRAITLTLLARRPQFRDQRDADTEAVAQAVFQTLSVILPPPTHMEDQIQAQLRKVLREAVDLAIEMRSQRAEYSMLPPLQPEYDDTGELAETVAFNAALMNERAGAGAGDGERSNEEWEAADAVVRVVLFPLVVRKGDDEGRGDDEVVVCPAQVLVARPHASDKRSIRMVTPSSDAGGGASLMGGRSATSPAGTLVMGGHGHARDGSGVSVNMAGTEGEFI